MNFKTGYLVAALVISVLALSSCEVYQTLYGTYPKGTATQVVRVEGSEAKDPANLEKMAYAAATPIPHDPFKAGTSPLGPFSKGKPLGFTLGQWLSASGIGIYSADGENAEMEFSFKNLVSNGAYTLWCSSIKSPPNPEIIDRPCGAEDGSENVFSADARGNGAFSLKLKALPRSTEGNATIIALAYHSDGKTYGASPGDFGLNSHVQIFFLMPVQPETQKAYQAPIKFVNHIDSGLPEQDIFIEYIDYKESSAPAGEAVKEQTSEKEKEEYKKTKSEEKPEEMTEEISKESPKEKPIVLVVQETDLISLTPKAEDPDKETALVFTFTSPLNENGEWQTTYGDGGEYTVTVTASDGELSTTKEVLIIVNKKEEAPSIDSTKPIESGLAIDETQSIEFSITASDLNKDPLSYAWKLDGIDVGTGSDYYYQTTYEDSGTHTVKADVSDGYSTTSKIWSISVKNVNRKPVLEKMDNIKAKETDKITITALATDDDKDKIEYAVNDKRFTQEDNIFTWQTDYDSAGSYKLIVSASDGQDTTEQEITIDVENVNRAPVITDIVQKK